MGLIQWNDSLSVNVAELDQQHQELITMINDLNDAILKRKGSDTLDKILEGLVDYAEKHFKTEERYFAQFGYPDADSHREDHLTFVLKVLDYHDKFKKEELFRSTEVLNFLCDWLKHHIKETDSKYSQFFNENGLR